MQPFCRPVQTRGSILAPLRYGEKCGLTRCGWRSAHRRLPVAASSCALVRLVRLLLSFLMLAGRLSYDIRIITDAMQLEFRCPECRVSGLTPEIEEDKAIAVALRQLRIRCPSCSAIVEVTEPLGRVLWKTRPRASAVLVERAKEFLSSLIREALEAKLERRAPKNKQKEQDQGQQNA